MAAVVCAIARNTFFTSRQIKKPVFFILIFIFLLGFAIAAFYSFYTYKKKSESKDLWKLGWLGLLGLIGL